MAELIGLGGQGGKRKMLALLLVLLLVALLFGLGFAIKWLFIVAAIVAVIWLIGLFARAPEARWYRW